MVNARKPHFFEVFHPSLSSERLEIPPKFIKHLEGRTSGSILLTGSSGNSWHVNLSEHNRHLFFEDGWPAFVKDHSIQCGDSLVFGYGGNMDFTVQIFDQTSCEKEETFYAKCSQELADVNKKLGKKRERDAATFFCALGENRMRGNCMPTDIDPKTGCKDDKVNASADEDLELEGLAMNGYVNWTCSLVKDSERSIILALPAVANQMMPIVINAHRNKNVSKLKKACSKKKKTDTKKETSISKFIEAKAAHYFTSIFPYFVKVMKYSNVNDRGTLKVPVHFSMAHFPNCRLKVSLQNLNGGNWMLNAVPTTRAHSTMHTFCGGWLAFVRGNRIKQEDVCIFELVDKFEMRVHILRLGLEGVDNDTQKNSIDVVGVGSDGLPSQMAGNVRQDNEAHPTKISKQADGPSIYSNEEHGKDSEVIPGPQQEVASSSDKSEDATVLTSSVSIACSPIIRAHTQSTDLLGCSAEGTVSHERIRKSQPDSHPRSTTQLPVAAEDAGAPLSFCSPFPNFIKVMMSSNVGGSFTLAIPRKFSAANLPSYRTEIVLRNVKGDYWNIISSRYGQQTKFCRGWMSFVRQNGLGVGDICVFELVDDRIFQVHIFPASQKVQKWPSLDAADDDSTASALSTPCVIMPETWNI